VRSCSAGRRAGYRLPVGFQNSATAADQRFSSRGLVLVDQAADNRSTSDPAVDRLEDGRFRTWRAQLQCSVRPMSVVMHRIPVKYAAQVSFPEDQHFRSVSSVRTVNTRRSAKQFARGHRGGILITSMPAPASTASNARVVPRHPRHQRGKDVVDRWPSRPVRLGPLPAHQAAMPTQDGARSDQTMATQAAGMPPDEGGEHGPVRPVPTWSRVGSAEDSDLMTQHEHRHLLRRRTCGPAAGPAQAPAGRSDKATAATRR
jgi:hypothetical protein